MLVFTVLQLRFGFAETLLWRRPNVTKLRFSFAETHLPAEASFSGSL